MTATDTRVDVVSAPNVTSGGRVHRARVLILGTVTTICGRTLNDARVTYRNVNCKACWKAAGA